MIFAIVSARYKGVRSIEVFVWELDQDSAGSKYTWPLYRGVLYTSCPLYAGLTVINILYEPFFMRAKLRTAFGKCGKSEVNRDCLNATHFLVFFVSGRNILIFLWHMLFIIWGTVFLLFINLYKFSQIFLLIVLIRYSGMMHIYLQ